MEVLREPADFDSIELVDGHIKATFSRKMNTVRQDVMSDSYDCFSDDIKGSCACYYDVETDVKIDVDINLNAHSDCLSGE